MLNTDELYIGKFYLMVKEEFTLDKKHECTYAPINEI